MTIHTMARFQRAKTEHTDWCARDHRCGVAEHRGPGVIADAAGGRGVVTRVRAADRDYAEITIRVRLDHREITAQRQFGLTLHLIRKLLTAVAAVRPEALTSATRRPALDRRPAA